MPILRTEVNVIAPDNWRSTKGARSLPRSNRHFAQALESQDTPS